MKIKAGEKEEKKSVPSSSSETEGEDYGRTSMGVEGVKKPKSAIRTFTIYISRVKKQVHPDLGISKSSMKIIESFIQDFFERLCKESSTLMTNANNKTLRANDVLTAINLVLPGELGKHAFNEAQKAINSYIEAS
jgi:histone H2B